MADDKQRCGAKCRNGNSCKSYAMANGRCRMHGGKSLKGTASQTWKSGLYSKYAGSQLKDILAELNTVDSEELINPSSEIKLMQALLLKCKSLEDGLDDLHDLDTISKIIERLIHAKQRSQKIMLEQERLIPVEDLKIFLKWMETLLIQQIGQSQTTPIMNQLTTFRISEHNAT